MSTTRPLEIEEYKQILKLLDTGFTYTDADGKEKIFRPNIKVKLALILEANLGLRISDILRLQVKNFKNNKLEIEEKKTNKLQYRDINP
ncbi:tyrosine-type recombinase/integrase, partial [Clostridioides difficile]